MAVFSSNVTQYYGHVRTNFLTSIVWINIGPVLNLMEIIIA